MDYMDNILTLKSQMRALILIFLKYKKHLVVRVLSKVRVWQQPSLSVFGSI